jgi:hypothetical protein
MMITDFSQIVAFDSDTALRPGQRPSGIEAAALRRRASAAWTRASC